VHVLRRPTADGGGGLRNWVPLAAVVALLGAAMLASMYANPVIPPLIEGGRSRRDTPQTVPSEAGVATTAPPSPSAAPSATTVPGWLSWVITTICLAAFVAVIVTLLWMLLRDRLVQRRRALAVDPGRMPTTADTGRHVRAAVDVGLADLDDADADPRRAVIACWLRLEAAAAAAGTPRDVGDTSTDLVARLLADHMVSADVLAGLAAVYREARFATHTVDETMRDQARSALRQLRDELTGGPSAMAGSAASDAAQRPSHGTGDASLRGSAATADDRRAAERAE
jgi:hypothetical protein